jgi:hypothetical protein
LYETGGSEKVGSQTKGAPSLTKGKADFQFHQKELDDETKQKLEEWFQAEHTEIYNNYLDRYKFDA